MDRIDDEVMVELHERAQGDLRELAEPVADRAGGRDAGQAAEPGDQGIAGDIAQVLEAASPDVEQRQDERLGLVVGQPLETLFMPPRARESDDGNHRSRN